jgi:pyruvate dehydrogenase (quinone)
VLVDAVVSRAVLPVPPAIAVLPVPPAITVEMAKGFTLYMVKAVFSGRGDDLIDFARSNLWA